MRTDERLSLGQWAIVGIATVAWGSIVLLGIAWFLTTAIETAAQRSEEHDRCLRQATNGLEIRECR